MKNQAIDNLRRPKMMKIPFYNLLKILCLPVFAPILERKGNQAVLNIHKKQA